MKLLTVPLQSLPAWRLSRRRTPCQCGYHNLVVNVQDIRLGVRLGISPSATRSILRLEARDNSSETVKQTKIEQHGYGILHVPRCASFCFRWTLFNSIYNQPTHRNPRQLLERYPELFDTPRPQCSLSHRLIPRFPATGFSTLKSVLCLVIPCASTVNPRPGFLPSHFCTEIIASSLL